MSGFRLLTLVDPLGHRHSILGIETERVTSVESNILIYKVASVSRLLVIPNMFPIPTCGNNCSAIFPTRGQKQTSTDITYHPCHPIPRALNADGGDLYFGCIYNKKSWSVMLSGKYDSERKRYPLIPPCSRRSCPRFACSVISAWDHGVGGYSQYPLPGGEACPFK